MENFENSRYFLPAFLIAFPLIFLTIWSFVMAILSRLSGWHNLAKHYRAKNEEVLEWKFRGGGGVFRKTLPFAGSRGRLAVGGAKYGVVIRPPFVQRPFHPKLFLPYDKMHTSDKTFLTLDWTEVKMADTPEVSIWVLKSAMDMARPHRA